MGEVLADEWEDVYEYNVSFWAGFIWLDVVSSVELSVCSSKHSGCMKVWGFLGRLSASQLMFSATSMWTRFNALIPPSWICRITDRISEFIYNQYNRILILIEIQL